MTVVSTFALRSPLTLDLKAKVYILCCLLSAVIFIDMVRTALDYTTGL